MSYAISEYPDAGAINARIAELMKLPPVTIRRDAMEAYLQQLDTRCAKSKAMIVEAKEFIPGGVQHNLSFNYPFPLVIDRAEGPYLYDIDGNQYIDFLQAGGPTVLGSNPPAVLEPVIELLRKCGPVTGLFHEFELKIAREINRHMPAVEMFRMLGSGTEAVMAALRVARLATGKNRIIKIGGAYHGWSDQMVYSLKIPRSGRFEAHGFRHQPRRQGDHHMPGRDLQQCVAGTQGEGDVVAGVGDGEQGVAKVDGLLRQAVGEGGDQPGEAARHPPGAAVDAGRGHRLGRLVGLVQVQHHAVVMLRKAGQPELREEGGDEGLGVGPEPGGAEIQGFAGGGRHGGEDAPAKAGARLVEGKVTVLPIEVPGQGKAAKSAADDRCVEHGLSFA